MKTCIDCKLDLELDQFNKHRDGYQSRCRKCDNAKNREWYRGNKEKTLARVKRNKSRYARIAKDFVWEYLADHPCVDCGEIDRVVLEFDHLTDKVKDVSTLMNGGWATKTLTVLKAEIAKCEVVCCNCHRRRTARRAGHWRVDWVI